jgi:aminoglycoside phosphotransferase family enzyme/predicted kinase
VELASLIAALSDPAAYPYPVEAAEVRQTHISAVFLAGPFAYKVKKPVTLPFLDFGTLEKRRHFCEEEVRLNRRLAPDVYLGVVGVAPAGPGLRFEGEGTPVEWAVKMRRLPDAATLLERLRRDAVDTPLIEELGRRIASFHRGAEVNERIASFGRFEPVSRAVRDVFAQAAPQAGTTVDPEVFRRVVTLAEEALTDLRPLIEARAARGVPRDCHGDLHLDHVYCFPERQPPADLVIIDCIEFNERLRFIDPVADMAFAAMDLAFHGRRDLARALAGAYFEESGDAEGQALLPLYTAYRACVRGEVEGLLLGEPEVPGTERAAALSRARGHWLLALGEPEAPWRRPCLLLVAGLPGSGKSTLARGLAERAGFWVIRSDVVRKELAGQGPTSPLPEALYTPGWDERTYAECLRRAEGLLFAGERVLVDATFRKEQRRLAFLSAAVRWGVPGAMFRCRTAPETVRRRLEARRADASDAGWRVYQKLAASWEEGSELTRRCSVLLSTEGSPEQDLARALEALRQSGLYG